MKLIQRPGMVFLLFLITIFGCKKNSSQNNTDNPSARLRYSDTVFYVKSNNYTVSPVEAKTGTYTSYPADLNIDQNTGTITVSVDDKTGEASQTGLRYKINYTSPSGQKDSTYIVIAGIHYQDRIYNMTQSDPYIRPIYNADPSKTITGKFKAKNNKVSINSTTGQINFKQSVANGLFQDDPQNDRWRKVEIEYETDDNSTTDENYIEIIMYYYTSEDHIASNVSAVMRAHQPQLLGIPSQSIPVTFAPEDAGVNDDVSMFKPRPPCIIIVGH